MHPRNPGLNVANQQLPERYLERRNMTEQEVTSWDEDLQEPARSFSASTENTVRAMAGPGTGKTFALMRRISRLLQEGVLPTRLAVFTFTRTAALDLKSELRALNTPGVDLVRVDTLHSFCFSTLQRNRTMALAGRHPRPLLNFEEKFMLADIEAETGDSIEVLEGRLKRFSVAWSNLESEQPGWPEDVEDKRFSLLITEWLTTHRAMLLDELVVSTWRYLYENPEAQEFGHYDHIIVDEYQDLNRADQSVIELLAKNGQLTIVGDPDQSIYSFRHANPEGMASFSNRRANVDDHAFNVCRRCPKIVVDMAVNLVSNNPDRSTNVLVARAQNSEGHVSVVQWKSLQAEAKGIAKVLKHVVTTGASEPGDVLILVPNRFIGAKIADEIRNAAIPSVSFFSQDLLEGNLRNPERCKAATQFSMLTLIANDRDRVSLRVLYGIGQEDLGVAQWKRFLATNPTNWYAINPLNNETNTADIDEEFQATFATVDEVLSGGADEEGIQVVDRIFPDSDEAFRAIRTVLNPEVTEGLSVGEIYELLRRAITQPEMPVVVDYARVMTLYKSKGLTAKYVVIAGFSEGLIPRRPRDSENLTDEQSRAQIEEQRRLMYVALTRTSDYLLLSSVKSMTKEEVGRSYATVIFSDSRWRQYTQTSMFYRELGASAPSVIAGDDYLSELA